MSRLEEFKEWNDWYDDPNMLRYSGNPKLWHWEHDPAYSMIVQDLKHGSILDDGGGFGHLKTLLNGCDTYVDLDISSRILVSAKKLVDGIQGDGTQLPFPSNGFDTVISYLVIRYLPKPYMYLKEAYRVLKPGGKFIVISLRKRWQLTWIKRLGFWLGVIAQGMRFKLPRNLLALRFPEGNPRFKYDHYTYEEHLRDWLELIGFRITKRTRCGMKIEGISLLHEHTPEKTWAGYNMERDGWMFYMVGEKSGE